MSRILITTVGTSLLTNRDDRPWAPWDRRSQRLPSPELVDRWIASANPAEASAELNTLTALRLGEGDRVRLLHSGTDEGRFCSARLRTWALTRVTHVDEIELRGLTGQHEAFGRAGQGLKDLIRVAVESVEHATRHSLTPVFCATGGFKAEIAFLNLFGALLGIEVAYIHEQFREAVVLPRLPISWNVEFARDNSAFFEWIDAEPRKSVEVEGRLAANPELRSLVVHTEDGHAYLDAAGELFWQAARLQASAPRACWPTADARPPDQKNGVSSVAHHRPKGWEAFVSRLCAIDCVTRVSYDAAAHGSQRVRVLDAGHGTIGVVFGTDNALPLRVETTARGGPETELVASYLRNLR